MPFAPEPIEEATQHEAKDDIGLSFEETARFGLLHD